MKNLPYYPIINFFIKKYNHQTYLELGVRDKTNTFNNIECEIKEGVDINPNCNPDYLMTTDEFFKSIPNDKTWDLIFIDADHEKSQVMRDFENSLLHLSENGTIIMDDINPTESYLLDPTFCDNAWEAFAELGKRSDLEIHAVIPSFSGFVRRGKQKAHSLNIESTYEFLNSNREAITRPVTWEQMI